MKNYYEILGVSSSASSEEIRKAYHKLAHKYHPDKGGDENKFKEINEAYQVLSDKEKRGQYDSFGGVFGEGRPGFDFGDWGHFGDLNLGLEDLRDIFEQFFSAGFERKRDLRKGKDIQIDIEILLESTLKGTIKEINLEKFIICSRCQGKGAEPGTKIRECFSCRGTGQVQQIKKTFFGSFARYTTCPECMGEGYHPEKPCNVCEGEGRIRGNEKIRIEIPAGVSSHQTIKIKGKGDAGKRIEKPGDLYVKFFVKPHRVFERKGDDLYSDLAISFTQATLEDEVEIETLSKKKILLKIPVGTQSGEIFKISGEGIPHFSGWGRGDLYIKIKVKTPRRLNKEQRNLLEKLREKGL